MLIRFESVEQVPYNVLHERPEHRRVQEGVMPTTEQGILQNADKLAET